MKTTDFVITKMVLKKNIQHRAKTISSQLLPFHRSCVKNGQIEFFYKDEDTCNYHCIF